MQELGELGRGLAQASQRQMGLALHGAQRDSEHLGGLPLGEVLEVAQHDHGALPRRQRPQRLEQQDPAFGLGGASPAFSTSYDVSTSCFRFRHHETLSWYITVRA